VRGERKGPLGPFCFSGRPTTDHRPPTTDHGPRRVGRPAVADGRCRIGRDGVGCREIVRTWMVSGHWPAWSVGDGTPTYRIAVRSDIPTRRPPTTDHGPRRVGRPAAADGRCRIGRDGVGCREIVRTWMASGHWPAWSVGDGTPTYRIAVRSDIPTHRRTDAPTHRRPPEPDEPTGTRNPEPGTRNPEPGTRNPEPGTRNPEPGTRNPEPGTRFSSPSSVHPSPHAILLGLPRVPGRGSRRF
jgi:hypothetical protein